MRATVRALLGSVAIAGIALAVSCTTALGASTYDAFTDPQPVAIEGYSGTAMEPFISPDGEYLLFNTSNAAPNIPALQLATSTGDGAFEYQGQLPGEGVNEPGFLSGTPTMDREGNLYFVSTRSYPQTLSTIYTGRFSAGAVTGVHLLAGVSGGTPGLVDFDASVSPDGATLFVSVGDFSSGSGPANARLVMYDRVAGGFATDPQSTTLLRSVDKARYLDYAAAVSGDGLELFFTRADPKKGIAPAVYRASRKKTTKKFGHVQRVGAITGFAEAPSLSADGTALYYHKLVGSGQFQIERVTRP